MWRIGVAMLLGHCCIHGLAELPALWPWAGVVLAGGALAIARGARIAAAFLLGFAWAWGNAAVRLAEDLPAAFEGEDLQVQGCIASLPDTRGLDRQFILAVSQAHEGVPSRLRLVWYKNSSHLYPGECWQLVVRLKRRNGFANPGGFDYEAHLFREGIGASGYVREDSRNRLIGTDSRGYAVARVRAWIAQRIDDAVTDDGMLGILQGLAVGDTQAMTSPQWRVFAATGTTHLMAISGLHIGMLAALAAWLGGCIVYWRGAQARGLSAVRGQVLAGGLAALSYSLLAGLSIPTQRTLIMLCIYFLARWYCRELRVGNALGLALIAVLIVDPFAPLAVGAWLSFGAVAVILMAMHGRLARGGVLSDFARMQFAVSIGLLPLLLGAFGNLSLISPLANALAVPFFTLLIVPVVLLGTLAAAIWLPAGSAILEFASSLLRRAWPMLDWLAHQPLAVWHFPQLPILAHAALIAGVLLLILPGIWPTRAVGVLLCLPALLHRPQGPANGDFELTVLDVGQGLATVVQTRSHALVYDTGPAFQSGRDAAELVVLPFLRHAGVRHVDTLIVSHGDLDHRGGMPSLRAGMPIARTLVGPSLTDASPAAVRCHHGQRWLWDGVAFEIVHPALQADASDNDSSCVVRITGSHGSALLTGDIEKQAERELLERNISHVDVVVAPHHGSRTSSTPGFVGALRPSLVVFSAGYRNRWGLPKGEVVERWRAAGARTLSTGDSGAIRISFAAHGAPQTVEHRRVHRRYWQRRTAPPAP